MGIRTLGPIVCSNFPHERIGAFKHLGQGSDTLFFLALLFGSRRLGRHDEETVTAQLVCNTLVILDSKVLKFQCHHLT